MGIMATTFAVHSSSFTFSSSHWIVIRSSSSSSNWRTDKEKNKRRIGRLKISIAKANEIKVDELRQLFISTNHSCHRFPSLDSQGKVQPVDPHKLQLALSHSSLLVFVYLRSPPSSSLSSSSCSSSSSSSITNATPSTQFDDCIRWFFGELVDKLLLVLLLLNNTTQELELVGFGRAVSDNGLTASIHDVVVLPSLQRLGIGRMIVQRIIRVLTNRGIYDISAVCSGKERLFFEACGFGDDMLGSTTMMYTRAPVGQTTQDDQMVKLVGRMQLLVPKSRESFSTERNAIK